MRSLGFFKRVNVKARRRSGEKKATTIHTHSLWDDNDALFISRLALLTTEKITQRLAHRLPIYTWPHSGYYHRLWSLFFRSTKDHKNAEAEARESKGESFVVYVFLANDDDEKTRWFRLIFFIEKKKSNSDRAARSQTHLTSLSF